MPTFDSFKPDLPASEWRLVQEEGMFRTWVNRTGDILQQRFVAAPPHDLPPNYPNVDELRQYFMALSAITGAVILSAEMINVQGVEGFQSVSKAAMPGEESSGFRYMGTVMFPLETFFSGFQFQCDERDSDAELDETDPNHPLARLHRYMSNLTRTITFDDEVRAAQPFRWKNKEEALAAIMELKKLVAQMTEERRKQK